MIDTPQLAVPPSAKQSRSSANARPLDSQTKQRVVGERIALPLFLGLRFQSPRRRNRAFSLDLARSLCQFCMASPSIFGSEIFLNSGMRPTAQTLNACTYVGVTVSGLFDLSYAPTSHNGYYMVFGITVASHLTCLKPVLLLPTPL